MAQYIKIPVQSLGTLTSNIYDSAGNVLTSTASALDVNIKSGTGTGLATAAKQDTGNTSLASIDGKITAVNTGAVVVSSSALPSGASTSALQSTGNTSLASIDGKITAVNTGAVVVASGTLTANIGTSGSLALDASLVETHGTKAAGVAAAKSNLIGGVYNSTLPTLTDGQQAAAQLDASGRLIIAPAKTGSGSAASATVSTVATLTAPANAVGFILMNLDTSAANVRWCVGRTATAALGQQLQPGRDTGFVPIGANVSVCAESGTQNIDIQWIAQ